MRLGRLYGAGWGVASLIDESVTIAGLGPRGFGARCEALEFVLRDFRFWRRRRGPIAGLLRLAGDDEVSVSVVRSVSDDLSCTVTSQG